MRLNEPNVFKVRLHTVTLNRSVGPVRVMCTGDWHVSPIVNEHQFEFLKEAIAETGPDVIILQGDLVDSPVELKRDSSLEKLERELSLCASMAPTVMVLGSHDFMTPTQPPVDMFDKVLPIWKDLCKRCGVQLLMDEWAVFDGIRIFGSFQDIRCMRKDLTSKTLLTDKHFDNPEGFLACLKDARRKIQKGLPKNRVSGGDEASSSGDTSEVLWFASHAPLINDEVIRVLEPFDIVSFGHTHGGIVPLGLDEAFEKAGLHFGLVSPNRKPFPRRVRGMMPISDSTMMLVNPGMIATHFCVSKPLQNLNFLKAAEVSVVQVNGK